MWVLCIDNGSKFPSDGWIESTKSCPYASHT